MLVDSIQQTYRIASRSFSGHQKAMWLTIQIAAGIVLAYVIIRNGAAVWRFSISALIVVIIAVAAFTLASFANQATAEHGGLVGVFVKLVTGAGFLLGLVAFITCIFWSGLSISSVISHFTKGKWPEDKWTLFLGIVNFMLTGFALQGFSLASNGPIFKATDSFGRAHGLADGVTMLLWVAVSLWPVPLAYFFKRKSQMSDKTPR